MVTSEQRRKLINALNDSGLFVTCGKQHPNVMTTHWGALGKFWNKQVFVLPVRSGKLSYELINETKSFAVSVPTTDMSREIMLCDTMSGYAVNKFEELRLRARRAKKIPAYVIGECGLVLECKVIYVVSPECGFVDESLRKDMYDGKNCHAMFFGEIVDCYEQK